MLGIVGREVPQEYLENVPLKLDAKIVIPIHFDNFFVSLEKKLKYLPGARLKEFLATAQKHRRSFEYFTSNNYLSFSILTYQRYFEFPAIRF